MEQIQKNSTENEVFRTPDIKSPDLKENNKIMVSWKVIKTFEGHLDSIFSVKITRDEKKMVSSSMDKTIKIWDIPSGKLLKTLEGHSERVNCVSFSNDERILASGSDDKTIKIWDVANGSLLKTLLIGISVFSLCFSLDDAYIINGAEKKIQIWEWAKERIKNTLESHLCIVTSINISPNGAKIVSGSADSTIKLWDLLTGVLSETFKGHLSVVSSIRFSPCCTTTFSQFFISYFF